MIGAKCKMTSFALTACGVQECAFRNSLFLQQRNLHTARNLKPEALFVLTSEPPDSNEPS